MRESFRGVFGTLYFREIPVFPGLSEESLFLSGLKEWGHSPPFRQQHPATAGCNRHLRTFRNGDNYSEFLPYRGQEKGG